jgi:hypothetical protein
MANSRTNLRRFYKKYAARAFTLCEQAHVEFGIPNSAWGPITEMDDDQLFLWAQELTRRLGELSGNLALYVSIEHESEKALELLKSVEKLLRSFRGGTI